LGKFWRRFDYLVGSAGISPTKIHWLGKILGVKKSFGGRQIPNLHRIEVNLKIAEPLLKETTKEPYLYISPRERIAHYLKKGVKNIGFGVGSGSKQKFKRWKKFRELIEKIDGNKLIFIGPDEVELEKEFQGVGEIVKIGLEDLPGLIARLDLVVANDNGIAQIGYGVKTNCVTIFGMTNHLETGGYRPNNLPVYLPLQCRPCFDPSTDKLGCQEYLCLSQLPVEKVLEQCRKFL
jgi:ADP-heptose:LPS heptosyltransferase